MEYITSRGFSIPTDLREMEQLDWFNMWERKHFPYSELLLGNILYWYETKTQRLVWKTIISFVERYAYTDKKKILKQYENLRGNKYYEGRPKQGYFVGYKVKVLERLDIPKPQDFNFPQLGWLRINDELAQKWFKRSELEDSNTLDENIILTNESLGEQLKELNQKMQGVSPERVERLVKTTIRKDTKIVNALKKACDYKCQFPDCGHRIAKKDGGFYIEVAHIKAVNLGGKSVLGNLLVLCPNHHKEFDYGNLSIESQQLNKIKGKLNGQNFEIETI
jgi:predicted restriction endonuclease